MIKSNKNHIIAICEPNLIPLLDFMLVLVIMFVLLAGPIQQAIKLPVPEIKKGVASNMDKKSVLISLKDKNNIYIENQHFDNINAVEHYLKTHTQNEITIAIDKKLEVDLLMKIFALSKSLGIKTANIQVENEIIK